MISYTIKNISGSIGQLAIDDIILNQGESAIIYVKTPDVNAAEAAGFISVTQNGTDTEITGADVITALGYTPYPDTNPDNFTADAGTVNSFSFTNGAGFTGVVNNSTTTPTLSLTLQNASTSQAGQLTNTDWNIFNAKQNALGFTPYNSTNPNGYTTNTGTVTNFIFTNANGFTGSVSLAGTTPTLSISLQDASTSLSGRLNSADWNTFNNKQDLLVSATNIKTINGISLLGAGNIVISGGGGGGSGTVTDISITTANGFAGSILNSTSTPAITISTNVTGLLKGNGTALSAATAGTDYLAPTGSGAALTGITSSQVSGVEAIANKDASNGYAGLTLFKINFKNVANTFTSFFTNTNTAARTYTFQNRDGTIADNTDLANKQDTLVSATNIKTIDGNNLLGSGNISIANKTITITGDVSGSGTSAITLILPDIATGATATKVTFNNKGQITSSSSLNSSDITTALTFTPYNATNPNGYTNNTGTVTTASVVSANGFAGSVATNTTTPAITISTSITGLLKGNGTAISAATAGTDYLAPSGNGSALTGLTASQISGVEATTNKDATGGYAGLTLFKINFKNAANTFTSFFTNTNSAARTYTFQNRDGTIADNTDLAEKQDSLVSGTNIKTINGSSLVGSGNLTISGGGGSTSITKTATGSISAYTVVKYVSATNVSTASNADSDLFNVVGIAESGVSNGVSVSITPTGQEISYGSWTWMPLLPVYLSTAGALTQTEPTTNSVLVIGIALSATVIKVDVSFPIKLVA